MGTMLERILDEILKEFQIGDKNNLVVVKTVSAGFSGAEVYIVELKHPSKSQGYFFLKIDTNCEEFDNHNKGFCFAKVAQCVEKKRISGYYVLLLQIAGKSQKECRSFAEITSPRIKMKATENMIADLVRQSAQKKPMIGNDIIPTELFQNHLKSKLDMDGMLAGYLKKVIRNDNLKTVHVINIENMSLPNAYAYATEAELWGSYRMKDTKCCIHGDLHDKNVFVSTKNPRDYILIDMASYNENGYLFFDTAYFELSILLQSLKNDSLDVWLECVNQTACRNWDETEYRDKDVIRVIGEQEEIWINEIHKEGAFNYFDVLNVSRLTARIMAGLNYAGKRKVDEDIRRRSFLYACCYLKELLAREKIVPSIAGETALWNEIPQGASDNRTEGNKCLDYVGRFDESARYILVLGNKTVYPNQVLDHLTRISWSGVISFNRDDMSVEEKFAVRRISPAISPSGYNKSIDSILAGSWWLYANGITADPESCKESYADWRNEFRDFFGSFCGRLGTLYAPNDVVLIVDVSSFQKERGYRYLQQLLVYMDIIHNSDVRVAILDSADEYYVDRQEYSNLKIEKFRINLLDIAKYCSIYMAGKSEDSILLPSRQAYPGVMLSKEDQQFIEEYVTLVHRKLSEQDDCENYNKKYSFYYGEPISWTAIDEELYISRKEIEQYITLIRSIAKESKDENKNGQLVKVVTLTHRPGAGATILSRAVCWKLKEEFPTIILKGRLNENVYESLRRISSLSGKYIVVLMDGDYDQNDVTQLEMWLNGHRIHSCIIYTHRIYNEQKDGAMLSILTYAEGIEFQEEYVKEMRKLKEYSEEECIKRTQNMYALSSDQSKIEFRLPFFYGMHAFEDDYQGVQRYLESIIEKMKENDDIRLLICYIALISRYTETEGLNFKYVRKLMNQPTKSGREILGWLQKDYPSLIYIVNSSFRICHPVIATKILQEFYPQFASEQYKAFCIKFIQDMQWLEKGAIVSDQTRDMMLKLFIWRDTEGELEENTKKKTFSQLILDINNANLQEQIFAELVKTMPDIPQFRQHYGRMIIINTPMRIVDAKEQFDQAIQLDIENGVYYHSRGDMYTRYIRHIGKTMDEAANGAVFYDKVATFVEEALNDYKQSIALHIKAGKAMELVYPFMSIIKTCTYVANQIVNRFGKRNDVKGFLEQNNEISRWCKKLISEAQTVDMETEYRYREIRESEIYRKTRQYLLRYNYTESELKRLMEKAPKDQNLKKAYLSVVEPEKFNWNTVGQSDLSYIIEVCEALIQMPGGLSEGVLWKWFNACIYSRASNKILIKMCGILETIEGLDNNLTANYFLYILYFCYYISTMDSSYIDKMKNRIELCRKLSNDGCNKAAIRYFYTGKGCLPLSLKAEELPDLDGTVVRIDGNQSGYLSLNMNPSIRAFFVPSHTDIRRGQEVNQPVKIKLGFSFDGLRVYELKRD